MLFALVNDAGLCEGVLDMERRSAASHPLRPGWRLLQVDAATHGALRFLGHGARHVAGVGWEHLPEAHTRRWNRATGSDFLAVVETEALYDGHVNALRAGGQLQGFREAEGTLPELPAIVRDFAPGPLPVLPDLVIREMTEAEALDCAERVILAGTYQEPAETTRIRVGCLFRDPRSYPLVVEWRGQGLQYEVYQRRDATTVTSALAYRIHRDRPYRFWREAFKPFFEALQGAGITRIESFIPTELGGYINRLVETYGAERTNLTPQLARLRYDLRTTLSKCTGFTARRTAGTGWEVTTGPVRTREVGSAELPAIRTRLAELWGARPRGAYAVGLLEERLALDAATVIVSEVGGQVVDVSASRERTPSEASILRVSPYNGNLPGQAERNRMLWHQAAGYATVSAFFPESMVEHPDVVPAFRRIGWEIVSRRPDAGEAAIEARVDVQAALARPLAAWTT